MVIRAWGKDIELSCMLIRKIDKEMPEFAPDYTQIIPKSGSFKADPDEDYQGRRCAEVRDNLEQTYIIWPTPEETHKQWVGCDGIHTKGEDYGHQTESK